MAAPKAPNVVLPPLAQPRILDNSMRPSKMDQVMHWVRASDASAKSMLEISNVVYPQYPERIEVFSNRLALDPDGCALLRNEAGDLAGYILSHPWIRGYCVALDREIRCLPATPDCLYLHDIALVGSARRIGAGKTGIDYLIDVARSRDLARICLVALPNVIDFWLRAGFAHTTFQPHRSYGSGAVYMERTIAGDTI